MGFIFGLYLFVIDIPGFEDSERRDDKNIESMNQYIKDNERIKSVIFIIVIIQFININHLFF